MKYSRLGNTGLIVSGLAFGQARGATVAQLALAWLLTKPVVASIGASKPHQLEDNLGVMKVSLTESEVAELDRITAPAEQYPNWFNERTADVQHVEALGD